ncbi:MAG: sugar phosphate isomerase/epimerase [Candidatus Lokiarchaeota archaeon]|nr:sugar phosphate isomerase/epimerase [Candidatus Lokiarchaeota archaeon]
MRFGISPLSLELVIDKILKEKGLAGLIQFKLSELIEGVAKAGYKHCEIILDIFQLFPIQITEEEIQNLKNIKQEYDMTYSAHFPFISIELASPNKFIREGSVNSIVDSYNTFIQLEEDIDVYVLHATGEFIADAMDFIMDPNIFPVATSLFADLSIQSIKEIIKRTGIDRKKIAIENFEFPFETTVNMVEKLGTKLCIDTAHVLGGLSGKVDLVDIAEKYLDIAGEIHLQDYSKEGLIDHGALGTGKNFPPEFLKLLHQRNFTGPIVFELPRSEALKSIEYIKKFVPQIDLPNVKDQPFY